MHMSMSIFRDQVDPYESMNVMFYLAKKWMKEGTATSTIAAYKMFSALEENYPDKAFKSNRAVADTQLEKLGALDQLIKDAKDIKDENNTKDKPSPSIELDPEKPKLYETAKIIFDLAQKWMKEKTITSTKAAYKMFSALEEMHPEKNFQSNRILAEAQLEKLGVLDQVINDEKSKSIRARL